VHLDEKKLSFKTSKLYEKISVVDVLNAIKNLA